MSENENNKKPPWGAIGFFGIVGGICVALVSPAIGAIIIAVGAAILIYALFTGQIKMFG